MHHTMPVKWATVLPLAALFAVLCSFVSSLTQLKDVNGNNVGWQVVGAMSLLLAIPVVIVCLIGYGAPYR